MNLKRLFHSCHNIVFLNTLREKCIFQQKNEVIMVKGKSVSEIKQIQFLKKSVDLLKQHRQRNNLPTGKVLPGILKIGTPPQYSLNRSALSVALVTISFISDRRATTRRKTPKRIYRSKREKCVRLCRGRNKRNFMQNTSLHRSSNFFRVPRPLQ